MHTEATPLHEGATMQEAVQQMIRCKRNGLIIINDEKKVVGILSIWDIIEHIVPDYLEEDKHLASFEAADVFGQRIKETANDPIASFMTTKVHTVQADDSLMQVATMLSEFRLRQLPIVDNDGVLVGSISRTDVKIAIGRVLGIDTQE